MKILKSSLSVILCCIILMSVAVLSPISVSAKTKPKLNKTKISIKVGKTYTLKLKNAKAKKVKWKSSKKSIATVSKKGKVTAKNIGTATVTAKYKSKKYKCKVTVKPKTISFSKSFKVYTNDTLKLTCTSAVKKWKISNKKIATINSSGLVKGKKAGKVTVTAICYNGFEAKGTVNVLNPYAEMKKYINKNGKSDTDGCKYISYAYDDYYFDVTYDPQNKNFQFAGYYQAPNGSYLVSMKISENGTSKPSVISIYESSDKEEYYVALSTLTAGSYTSKTNLNFTIDSGNVTDSDYVNQLSNALLHDSFSGWKTILSNHLSMKPVSLGFSKI